MTDQHAPLPAGKPCDDDTDDKVALIRAEAEKLNAEADHIEAEAKLLEVKQPLYDRLVTRWLVPFSLAFAAPMATYYFANKTDEGIREVQELRQATADLKSVVVQLDGTLKTAMVQIAVLQMLQQRQPAALPRLPQPSDAETARQVADHFEIPGMSKEQVRREAARVLGRLDNEQK